MITQRDNLMSQRGEAIRKFCKYPKRLAIAIVAFLAFMFAFMAFVIWV